MPTYEVTSPNGQTFEVNAPEGATQEEVMAYAQQNFGNDNQEQPGFLSQVGDKLNERGDKLDEIVNAYNAGEQGLGRSALQTFANVGLGGLTDIGNQIISSAASYVPVPEGYEQGISNIGSAALNSPLAEFGGNQIQPAYDQYQQFREQNPAIGRDIDAAGNIINIAGLVSPVGRAVEAGSELAATAGQGLRALPSAVAEASIPSLNPLRLGTQAVEGINNGIDNLAQYVSRGISRSQLPQEAAGLSDAEALFYKSLQDEGISPQSALAAYSDANSLQATPSVAVTSGVPSMKSQALLMNKGSSGSNVAASAIKNIDDTQIPKLNNKIIQEATGGTSLDAEQYGEAASKIAKDMVQAKKDALQTRAKPYYAESIGIDKSIPETNDAFKKALGNKKVVEALDKYRTDTNTLTNVQNDLQSLGIDATDLEKLPYNSTVALHSARVNLREQADSAFRSGDTGVYKAAKSAINDIDSAIESEYPSYKTARRIYSEDSGALKTLQDSPIGKMSMLADGNYSKAASDLMARDPGYIKKFVSNLGNSGADGQKIRDSLAGAYLKKQLQSSANDGRRFSDTVLKNQEVSARLKALVGDDRFNQINKIDTVIDQLIQTRQIGEGSATAPIQAMREIPTSIGSVLNSVRNKISPSLLEVVRRDPTQAARYNELLFTDEGYKLLDKISKTPKVTPNDVRTVGNLFNKLKPKEKQ